MTDPKEVAKDLKQAYKTINRLHNLTNSEIAMLLLEYIILLLIRNKAIFMNVLTKMALMVLASKLQ